MRALYIGENKKTHAYLQDQLRCSLVLADSPAKAKPSLQELTQEEPVFIFIEGGGADRNIRWISMLKKNTHPDIYLLLVSDQIPRNLIYGYINSGVSEIIRPDITAENLGSVIALLPRLKKTPRTASSATSLFKLPLWKRCFDITAASAALICLSPLLLLTALAIRLESKGPVIYTSKRVGSNYRIFGFLKFRSMYPDADKRLLQYKALNQYREETGSETSQAVHSTDTNNETMLVGDDFRLTEEEYIARRNRMKANNFIKIQNDPRITRVGHFIRKYSIDELPQLINILKGDMSVVGNRPLPIYEAEMLTTDEYIERFMAPAGLTGLWQVEKRGTEGILSAEERKQLDIQYSKKFSFLMDVKIIVRTFTAFIQKEDV